MTELPKLAGLVQWLERIGLLRSALTEWEAEASVNPYSGYERLAHLERAIGWHILFVLGSHERAKDLRRFTETVEIRQVTP